jgi:hypothetical protein
MVNPNFSARVGQGCHDRRKTPAANAEAVRKGEVFHAYRVYEVKRGEKELPPLPTLSKLVPSAAANTIARQSG